MKSWQKRFCASNLRLTNSFADVTGQPLDVIQHDTDRDFYMTAEQAVQYGLIDKVLEPPRSKCLPILILLSKVSFSIWMGPLARF